MIDSWTKTIRNFSRNSPKPNVERAHGTKTWGGGEVEDIGPETRETVASSHNRRPPVPPRQRAQPSEEGEGRIPARGATAIVRRPCQIVQRGTMVCGCMLPFVRTSSKDLAIKRRC